MDVIKLFSGGFPLTIERLEFLQNTYGNAFKQLTSVLGDGDFYILDGVNRFMQASVDTLSDGVVVINGEILPFIGGNYSDTIIVRSTSISVPYNEDTDNDGNLDLRPADTARVAMPMPADAQADDESSNFSDFMRVPKLSSLLPTVGDIKMIARAYDSAIDIGWQLLDMEDTFPMGAGGTSSVNATGGENSVTLTSAQMPPHNHNGSVTIQPHTHEIAADGGSTNTSSGTSARRDTGDNGTIQTDSAGGHTANFTTNNRGGGAPHENRPKFKAFNFLIFVGI